ncbi:MAG: acyl carrier protein [Lachnospiraceae bacterium]|nr:acyl carrier protein [Lachnospiraceae bacterium]
MELEKLQAIIAEVLQTDAEFVSIDMSFYDDLGADSLELFQIVMGVESEFDIVIDEDTAASINTVEDLYKLIAAG